MWPNLRKKTLICYYLWFSTALIYYGLTLNSNTLGTDLFLTFSIGKVMIIKEKYEYLNALSFVMQAQDKFS